MDIQLLGQGLENESKDSVGYRLVKLFSDREFHTFTGISAFASASAVNGIGDHLAAAKEHLNDISVTVGIDQKGTSKEALEALLNLGVNSFVFYFPSGAIFHPKIYLFEGVEKSTLIIGSSNLTSHGLFSNVETSVLVNIDNEVDSDKGIVQQLKNYFEGIFLLNDPNLKALSPDLILNLVDAKLVPTEAERRNLYRKTGGSGSSRNSIVSGLFPKRSIPGIPQEFKSISASRKSNKRTSSKIIDHGVATDLRIGKMVWTRRSLPNSSVQIYAAATNPTGGLRLVQDRFEAYGKRIDQTTYFRNDLFGQYNWTRRRVFPFVEVAIIPFEITVRGKFLGKYNLEVRHKPTGEAGQHNYTTSISWGDLGDQIKKSKLSGLRLDLYAPIAFGKPFKIAIS